LSRFGEWVDVVIDDVLPTKDNRLMYAKSSTPGEMWSSLLEKAYAKVSGGYSALEGGTIPEALEDFTGGIAETVSLSRHTSEDIWDLIVQSEQRGFPMACYIEVRSTDSRIVPRTPPELIPLSVSWKVGERGVIGQVNEDGLVLGHAYSIIGATEGP
ncbi:PREDICTED: calpain-1 catalytic subunit-like, partial [Nanorana parkeri]|uniref:calpain-1 catalytic subunit-like n=1 Tax=Nanorana parkeri TaxID=125878 RepID=UPI000854A220